MYEKERKVYSMFSLISDFGGFYGAIIPIFSFFLSLYTPSMYEASLLANTPIKRQKRRERSQQRQVREALANESHLSANSAVNLINEIASIEQLKLSFFQTLCSFKGCRSRSRQRESNLRKKTTEMFEKQLDIRSLVSVNLNLSLLLSLLLNRQQMRLFKSNSLLSVHQDERDSKDSSSDSDYTP